ncbi:MAG: hypothetical protein PGN13_01055 [Patulibacter minatonensis]
MRTGGGWLTRAGWCRARRRLRSATLARFAAGPATPGSGAAARGSERAHTAELERQRAAGAGQCVLLAPVLPEPRPLGPGARLAEELELLLAAHRAFVDVDPARFEEITRLASSALLGDRGEVVAALVDRSRRTRRAVLEHLEHWHAAGLTELPHAQLGRVADVLVAGATGIELCFQWDHDQVSRLAAYRELSASVRQRLAGA